MYSSTLALLLVALPLLVKGYNLDNQCNAGTVYTSSRSSYDNYYVFTDYAYNSGTCVVRFDSSGSGKIKLQITGSSLQSSMCQVSVYSGSSGQTSLTFGNLNYMTSFSRTFTTVSSVFTALTVKVSGSHCTAYNLDFKVKKACGFGQFTCDSGECIPSSYACDGDWDCTDGSDENGCVSVTWSGGYTAGTVVGVIFFFALLGFGGFYYRRRTVLVRSQGGIVNPATTTTVVTQSRY